MTRSVGAQAGRIVAGVRAGMLALRCDRRPAGGGFMTKLLEHPALSLPEKDRMEYLNVIASMALVDGKAADPELAKLKSLGSALKLPAAVIQVELASLKKGKIAGPV